MNTPATLTYTLEEVLQRFEQNIAKQFTEVNQKMDKQFAEVNQKMDKQFAEVNQKMDKQFAEVSQKFIEVDHKFEEVNQKLVKLQIGQSGLSGEIKALDEKFSGKIETLDEKIVSISKRIDYQEFINRSVTVAMTVAFIGGVAKFLFVA
jgi:DNA anti-recombination protein RmuC